MNPDLDPSVEPIVESLSRREGEILALLAQGYTGPEIAEKLTIALSSVRSHLQNIYGKLGVSGKRSALNRASALGLLPAFVPAAPPTVAPRHNLPMELTRFFGRESEIEQLKELLAEYRLVTVTGAGGVGKTRLTLRVAEEVLDSFLDGVWFVELAALSDPALVVQETALTLGVREGLSGGIREAIVAFLRERQVLLVLDNCEHLLGGCARLADNLLRACPRVTVLATSREALGGDGEAVFRTPSLPFPEVAHALPLEAIAGFPSVRLFVDRARMLRSDYQITSDNAGSLAQICARLDGLPLAIEMAAARINVLTAEQLAGRLDDAFLVLTGGRRTALPRQQTLRATIEWSYALLNEEERLLLQRLSVFAGGCTLAAAEAVCVGDAQEAGRLLDVLASLVAKSMVIADLRQDQAARYQLLEMVRQFAAEKQAAATDREPLRCRHRDYFLKMSEERWTKDINSERSSWDTKIHSDRENVRQALEWSFTDEGNHGEVAAGPRLLIALDEFWPLSWQELVDWHDRTIRWCESHPEISPRLLITVLETAAGTLAFHDLKRALSHSQQALRISRNLGPEGTELLMWSLIRLASIRASQMELETAQEHYSEAETIFNGLAPDHFPPKRRLEIMADFSAAKARLANKLEKYSEAKRYAADSMRLYDQVGRPWTLFFPNIEMGSACLDLVEYDLARQHFFAALHLQDNITEVYAVFRRAFARRCLGMVELATHNLDDALEYCQAGLSAAREISARGLVASCLTLAAHIHAKQGQLLQAARLIATAQTLYDQLGGPPWENTSMTTLFPGWPNHPNREAIAQAYAAGQTMSADDAVTYALGEDSPL